MNLSTIRKPAYLLASLLLLPAAGFSAPHECAPPKAAMSSMPCPCGQASMAAAKWDFQKEGSRLLEDINRDAREVRHHAAILRSQYPTLADHWEFQASELNMVRYEVNQMGEKLCRLQTIHDQLMPWQQKAVESTAPVLKELAIFTTDSINFANNHRSNLWNPLYRTYLKDMYREAQGVSTASRSEG